MIRITAVIGSVSLFLGCAAAPRPPVAASEPRQPVPRMSRDWQQLPAEQAGGSGLMLQNRRTKATVTVSIFVSVGQTLRDVAGDLALRLAADGNDVSGPETAPDGESVSLRWSGDNAGHRVRGKAVLKRFPDSPLLAALVLGVWPEEADEAMLADFEAIVAGLSLR